MKPICYIIKFKLEDEIVYKIGVTKRNIKKRLSEILMSFFDAYRYVPETRVRKFSGSFGYMKIESTLHKEYKHLNYIMPTKISGKTEYFKIPESDEEKLLERYCELIDEYRDYLEPDIAVSEVTGAEIQYESINDLEPTKMT